MSRMKGRDKHMKRLKSLTDDVVKMAGQVVYVGSDLIRASAVRSITAGSISGKGHIPSKPGEAPNNDTGVLKDHITNQLVSPLTAEVRSDAPYAAALETGTSKMAARPYMRPARDAEAPKIQRLFATEMSKLVKRSGR